MYVHLVEPEAEGHVSGGFLYNERMCTAGGLSRHRVHAGDLRTVLSAIPDGAETVLVADSLFYGREVLAPFLEARAARECQLALLVHAFPSFVRRAQDRAEVVAAYPLLPTDEEVALASEVDFLISPGPAVARQLALRGCPTPVVIASPGMDAPPVSARHAPLARTPGPLRFVTIGAVSSNKGLLDGLDALAALRDRDWTWTIVGSLQVDLEAATALRNAIALKSLGGRTRLSGQLDRAGVWRELQRADAFLFPSYTENYPLVAAEAIAAQTPVVAYSVGGIPDIVTDEWNGLLATPFDVDGLTEHLKRLLDDPSTLKHLANGCARSPRLPSWQQAAEDLRKGLWDRIRGSRTRRDVD